MGVPQNIMRTLFAVIWPDHFKFASYGAVTALKCYSSGSIEILVYDFTAAKQVNRGREAITYTYECAYWFSRIHCEIDIIVYVRTVTAACSLKT